MAKSTDRIQRTLRNMERLATGGANAKEISVYLRSEGYDPKSFANAVGKYNQSQGVIAEFGPVRSALQGLSFGFSDEAEAGIKALLGKGTYEQNLAALGLAKEEFQQQSPGTALATELAGGVPYMFAGGLGAMRTLGTLPQMARVPKPVIAAGGAAGAGGISAGISGAGTAEPGQRMAGAAEMAPIGAAFGVGGTTAAKVLPKVPGVQQLGELGRRMIGAESGFAQRADIKLLQALQRDGISPADAMARLQAIKSSNYKPETIIELGGENTRRLADIVAQYPGASQTARALAEERGAGAGQRVMQDFRQAFQVNADAMDLTESLTRQREQLARPLYQQAYAEGGVIKDERITKLMQIPQFQDAYARARRIAALDGIPLPEKASDIEKVGGFDLQTLDYIKRGLDDVLFTGKQPGSGIGKTELSKLKERRKEFVDVVDEVGPASYKQARSVYAGTTEILDAIDDGKKFATLDPRALQRKFDSLNESEKEAFKIGVYDSIRTNINKGADGADVLRRVWKSPEKRDQLKVFLGDDTYNDLSTQLARENVIRQTDIKLTGGSPTQPRQLAQREFEGEEGLIPQVATGGMRGGLNYLLRTATGPGQPTAEALAPTLFSTDVGQQIQALTRLQTLDELLRRQAAGLGGAVGAGAGTATGLLGE
jgi:hypothetical protein